MPYIVQERRDLVRPPLYMDRRSQPPVNPGELNFAITRLIVDFLATKSRLDYAGINDVRGAVAGALVEFEQRIARPYEDQAIERNGDVYPDWLLVQTKGDR